MRKIFLLRSWNDRIYSTNIKQMLFDYYGNTMLRRTIGRFRSYKSATSDLHGITTVVFDENNPVSKRVKVTTSSELNSRLIMNLLLFLAVSSWHVARCMETAESQHVCIDNQQIDDARATSEREISFSLDLYKAAAKERPGLFALSPADVFVSLSKLHSAAKGSSQQQLSDVLHYYPGCSAVAENGLRKLVERMAALRSIGAVMNNDIIYPQERGPLSSSLMEIYRNIFHYEPQSYQLWNSRNRTQSSSSSPILLPEEDSLSLAIEAEFSSLLDLKTFYPISMYGSRVYLHTGIDYMIQFTRMYVEVNYGELKYRRDSNDGEATATYIGFWWRCFLDCEYQMKTFVILPDERYGISELERNINETAIHEMLSNTSKRLVKLVWPGYISMESTDDLRETLKSMGLTEMFKSTRDFENAFRSLHPLPVGSVFQETYMHHHPINVVTGPIRSIIPPGTTEFVVDHTSMILTFLMDENPLIIAMARYAGELLDPRKIRFPLI